MELLGLDLEGEGFGFEVLEFELEGAVFQCPLFLGLSGVKGR